MDIPIPLPADHSEIDTEPAERRVRHEMRAMSSLSVDTGPTIVAPSGRRVPIIAIVGAAIGVVAISLLPLGLYLIL